MLFVVFYPRLVFWTNANPGKREVFVAYFWQMSAWTLQQGDKVEKKKTSSAFTVPHPTTFRDWTPTSWIPKALLLGLRHAMFHVLVAMNLDLPMMPVTDITVSL